MASLYKDGALVEDSWRDAEPDAAIGETGTSVILTLPAWKAARDTLAGTNQPLGVRLEAGEMIDDIVDDLPRLSLVALSFPKYTDGRAFSKARVLRGDLGYKGEIRAVGEVLWDQLQLMTRCGFDAFEITNEPTLAGLRAGKAPFMSRFYQPGLGPETKDGATRAWARRAI